MYTHTLNVTDRQKINCRVGLDFAPADSKFETAKLLFLLTFSVGQFLRGCIKQNQSKTKFRTSDQT